MKKATSRRSFMQKTALATTGIALLSSGVTSVFAGEIPFDGYNPYADSKTDLRTASFGKHLDISGVIYDSNNQPISNSMVEVWHLSPNSRKYRHRTKLITNENGEYHFITDVPGKEKSKASRIYYKVSKNNVTYFSELIVTSIGAHITCKHWTENKELGKNLLPITTKGDFLNTGMKINFNLILTN